jgi:glycyl-tRNA synthetase beta chain
MVGFFAIDERPTGSKDPFALRRAALGIIRLILENRLRLALRPLFHAAHGAYTMPLTATAEQTADQLMEFFADRLKVHLREKGVRHDLISAVFAIGGEDDLVRLLARVEALAGFLSTDDGANLLVAYRRAANIVRIEEKKDGRSYRQAAPSTLASGTEEEDALASALATMAKDFHPALKAERFTDAMADLAALRGPVDTFFEGVTVNSSDATERDRRLRLLGQICDVMDSVADFSQIEG